MIFLLTRLASAVPRFHPRCDCYRAADVFVFPSKTDTFGQVMVEAMASGLPVAAYDTTGPAAPP